MSNVYLAPSGKLPAMGDPGVMVGGVFVPVAKPQPPSTLLLMHFDGDLSYSGELAGKLNLGLFGGAVVSTEDSKFGGSSLKFTGSDDDYLKIDATPDLDLTGPFTVDFWLNPKNSSHCGFFYMGASWSANTLSVHTNGGLYWMQPGSRNPSNTPVVTDQWAHVEYSRDASNVFRLFLNGVMIGMFLDNTNYEWVNVPFYLSAPGSGWSAPFNGFIDEFRISDTCRHTENFDPPTTPYSETT